MSIETWQFKQCKMVHERKVTAFDDICFGACDQLPGGSSNTTENKMDSGGNSAKLMPQLFQINNVCLIFALCGTIVATMVW